jgi:hypothetical protein
MDEFDGDGDDPDEKMSDGGYAGPRRRWSDESTDTDLIARPVFRTEAVSSASSAVSVLMVAPSGR